jgi:hypothetical protein
MLERLGKEKHYSLFRPYTYKTSCNIDAQVNRLNMLERLGKEKHYILFRPYKYKKVL